MKIKWALHHEESDLDGGQNNHLEHFAPIQCVCYAGTISLWVIFSWSGRGGVRGVVVGRSSGPPLSGLSLVCVAFVCGQYVVWVASVWSGCGLGCLGFTGGYWGVLGFTGCGLGFTGPHWTLLGVDWVSLDFTGPPWTPLDPPWPHWNLLELTGIYWNLLELLTQHWPPWLVSTAFQPLGFMTSPPLTCFHGFSAVRFYDVTTGFTYDVTAVSSILSQKRIFLFMEKFFSTATFKIIFPS